MRVDEEDAEAEARTVGTSWERPSSSSVAAGAESSAQLQRVPSPPAGGTANPQPGPRQLVGPEPDWRQRGIAGREGDALVHCERRSREEDPYCAHHMGRPPGSSSLRCTAALPSHVSADWTDMHGKSLELCSWQASSKYDETRPWMARSRAGAYRTVADTKLRHMQLLRDITLAPGNASSDAGSAGGSPGRA